MPNENTYYTFVDVLHKESIDNIFVIQKYEIYKLIVLPKVQNHVFVSV